MIPEPKWSIPKRLNMTKSLNTYYTMVTKNLSNDLWTTNTEI